MVNASLNWASIVGIVLAICGAGLYFMRSFKPALARDYDVFFAAIGLLCGGILFFQGWRLDPILQFGQFLLAGTTVFFAYESVRLRGVATDQARRSSYFDDPMPSDPSRVEGLRGRNWEDNVDSFDEPQRINRRFSSRNEYEEEPSERDIYRTRRASRVAIPEEAESRVGRRRRTQTDSFGDTEDPRRRRERFRKNDYQDEKRSNFGSRRNARQDLRRGTRPLSNEEPPLRRRKSSQDIDSPPKDMKLPKRRASNAQRNISNPKIEDAAFSSSKPPTQRRPQDKPGSNLGNSSAKRSSSGSTYSRSPRSSQNRNRDNTSRFDD
ncbi:Ycf66 family protein [Prochlorococcus sp. MIT 1223]|uniref:Ycf66 family protein n=1 Tax=Prochlorococcus sp. MIT 1223 TaxID=3096217 RepID=UPI002A754DAF|nr:Ycf66 family protein [Prochlorococcus sp. MIT 1223]